MCCGKILVNVAAYVITGWVCVCVCVCVCMVRSKQETPHHKHTHTNTPLTSNYICSHIYQDFVMKTQYYIVFYHLIIHNFSWHNCKLPEDGVLTL